MGKKRRRANYCGDANANGRENARTKSIFISDPKCSDA
jgi:hypothetical protein